MIHSWPNHIFWCWDDTSLFRHYEHRFDILVCEPWTDFEFNRYICEISLKNIGNFILSAEYIGFGWIDLKINFKKPIDVSIRRHSISFLVDTRHQCFLYSWTTKRVRLRVKNMLLNFKMWKFADAQIDTQIKWFPRKYMTFISY